MIFIVIAKFCKENFHTMITTTICSHILTGLPTTTFVMKPVQLLAKQTLPRRNATLNFSNTWIQQLDGLYPLRYFFWMWHFSFLKIVKIEPPNKVQSFFQKEIPTVPVKHHFPYLSLHKSKWNEPKLPF
jgi:hypothetical protein